MSYIVEHMRGKIGRRGRALTGREICASIIGIIVLIIAMVLFFLYMFSANSDHPLLPVCSIQKIYIPFLDKISSSNSTSTNQTIYFDLKLRNRDATVGVIYYPLNLTFSYNSSILQNQSVSAIGNFSFPGFHQGYGKTAHRRGLAPVEINPLVEDQISLLKDKKEIKGYTASLGVLRIELITSVKYESWAATSDRHKLRMAAKVQINDGGEMVNKHGIKLTKFSGAPVATIFGGYVLLLIAFSSAFNLALL